MDRSRKIILVSCLSMAFLAGVFACSVEDVNLEKKDLFVCKTEPGCMVVNADASSDAKVGTCQIKSIWESMNPSGTCLECAATKDDSCLAGSYCIAINPDHQEGRCVAEEDIEHCHDYDGDTYYGADPGFEANCGFTQSMPKDCDDSNPEINAKATEVCDGVDNTCDGCTDGICPTTGCDVTGKKDDGGTLPCDCATYADLCEPLVELCIGAGSVASMMNLSKAVCRPDIAGVNYCSPETDKQWEYRVLKDGVYEKRDGECPKAEEGFQYDGKTLYYTYDEVASSANNNPNYCNGFDSDCNGSVDCLGEGTECGCPQTCDEDADTNDTCFVLASSSNTFMFNLAAETAAGGNMYDMYMSLLNKSEEVKLKCTGTVSCPDDKLGNKVCKDKSGALLTTNPICTTEEN